MLSRIKSRRGVTLAEIMVVLAMVAIMITMVVSFSLLISEHTRTSLEHDTVIQDRQVIESGVENWLSQVTKKSATLTCSSHEITATIADATYTLKFSNGALIGELPDDQTITIHTQTAKAVNFELMQKGSTQVDYLLFCTILSKADTDEGYTFCVNPHVGEQGGNGE